MEIKRLSVDLDLDDIYRKMRKLPHYRGERILFELFSIIIDEDRNLSLTATLKGTGSLYYIYLTVYYDGMKLYTVKGDTFDVFLKLFRIVTLNHIENSKIVYTYLIKINAVSTQNLSSSEVNKLMLNGYQDNILTLLIANLLYNSFETNEDIFDMYIKLIYAFRCHVNFNKEELSDEEKNILKFIVDLLYQKSDYYSLDIPILIKEVNKTKLYKLEKDLKNKDYIDLESKEDFISTLTTYVGLLASYVYKYINDNSSNKNYSLKSDTSLTGITLYNGYIYFSLKDAFKGNIK